MDNNSELDELKAILHDDLYNWSRDWREGSLKDRVEWLLVMYESAKETLERM